MKHLRIYIAFLITGIIINGCIDIPEDVIMPEWDVNLNVPVTNKYLTLEDFIDEQENLSIDPEDSLYIIRTKEYTHTRSLLEFIQISQAVEQNNIPIPPVNDSADIFLDFRSNVVEMESAVFAEGFINLGFNNTSTASVTFTLTFPGIRQNGEQLSIVIPLAPGESRTFQQDLAGYIYSQPLNQPLGERDRFWVKVKSSSAGSAASGLVFFDVQITEFSFSSVTGSFAEQNLGRRTETFEAELGRDVEDFKNKVTLSAATLSITARYVTAFENPFDFRVDSLTVLARSNGNDIYLTDSTGSRYITFTITDGLVTIYFTENNSNILDIVNSVPDMFEVGASLKILGKNQSGTLSEQDITIVGVELNTKSIFALASSTVSDTTFIDISDSDREEIRNAKVGSITAEINNAIPVKGWLKAEFYDSLYNPTFTLRVDNQDSVALEGAFVDPVSGEVTAPSTTVKSLSLTEDEIISLSRSYYVSTSVTVQTSGYRDENPVLVPVRASDWMKVKITGKIRYRVKDL